MLRTLLILYALSPIAYACMIPAPGYQWTGEDLAQHSRQIVLAEVNRKNSDDMFAVYEVHIKEIIRAKDRINNQELIYHYFVNTHSEQTFNNHNDEIFWQENIGRTKCEKGCFCGVNHVFKKGTTYLLFLDKLGALKSAEIIKNRKHDKWLKYVKNSEYKDKN